MDKMMKLFNQKTIHEIRIVDLPQNIRWYILSKDHEMEYLYVVQILGEDKHRFIFRTDKPNIDQRDFQVATDDATVRISQNQYTKLKDLFTGRSSADVIYYVVMNIIGED